MLYGMIKLKYAKDLPMSIATKLYTTEEFFAFIAHPENVGQDFELIGGRIIPVVADGYSSEIGSLFSFFIQQYLRDNDMKGRVTGADGGYMVSGKPYIPDVAFISHNRQPQREQINGYNILAPNLAVEVQSPTDREVDYEIKIADYLNAGTTVWYARPRTQTIRIYVPNADPIELTVDDILEGGDIFPNFSVPVKEFFPEK